MRGFKLCVPQDCVVSNTPEDNAYALHQVENVMKGHAAVAATPCSRRRPQARPVIQRSLTAACHMSNDKPEGDDSEGNAEKPGYDVSHLNLSPSWSASSEELALGQRR